MNMKLSSANFLGLRTHYVDDDVQGLARSLSSSGSGQFAVLLDETGGVVNTAGLPVVSVTNGALDRLGLRRDFDAPTWRCGDYALYIAADAYPHCEFYWLVEPDVWINFQYPGDFFSLYADDPSDLLCAHLKVARPDWDWYPSMADERPTVHRCLFSTVRLSRRALSYLVSERRRMRDAAPEARWPNDEAFVATMLMEGGFRCRDLNEEGRSVYSPHTFTYDRPIARSDFYGRPFDQRIYHPVLSGDRLYKKIRREAQYGSRDVCRAMQMVTDLIDTEWSKEDAARYLTEIEASCKPPSSLDAMRQRWRSFFYRRWPRK